MSDGFEDTGKDLWDSLMNGIAEIADKEAFAGYDNPSAGSPNSELSIAQYMFINEMGTADGRIPARPFMAQAFDNNKAKYEAMVVRGYDRLAKGSITPKGILLNLAIEGRNDIVRIYVEGDFKDNADSTVARKGSSRPLVNYSMARNSTNFGTRRAQTNKDGQ